MTIFFTWPSKFFSEMKLYHNLSSYLFWVKKEVLFGVERTLGLLLPSPPPLQKIPQHDIRQAPQFSVWCWKVSVWSVWFWEDVEAKLSTPGQLLGYPWKVWGITVQTSYWEGRWDQNWVRSRPTNFFTKATRKFVKNGNFLLFGLKLENKERYRDGSNGCWNDAHIQGNKCPVDNKWLRGRFDRVLPARSWEIPVERELPAKIGRCSKKLGGHNFDFRAKSFRENFFYIY